MSLRTVCLAFLAICMTAACQSKLEGPQVRMQDPEADADTDSDADSDADADTDSDADADADSDADADADADSDADSDADADADPWSSPPPADSLDTAALSAIQADIDAILASTSATHTAMVVDAENGQVVYTSNPDALLKPASNTKLFTSGLAMDLLGEDHQMPLTAYASAPSGSVDLAIVGEHDFTWSTEFYGDPDFPALQLAARIADAGVTSIGTLTVQGEYLVDGYQFGYYDASDNRNAAADVLEIALLGQGISVGSVQTSTSFTPPGGWSVVAERLSLPLWVSNHPLNVYSHNEFADIQARHNGLLLWGGSTYGDNEAAMVDWLSGLGVGTTGLELYDGSGLSHDNRVSARMLVDMQATMLDRPAAESWRRTYSVGGVIGTLGSRLTGSDTEGRFFGKTGTLTGVIATSGVLHHAHDGHRYFVSVLMNGVTDNGFARGLQDDVIEIIARDNRTLGNRPDTPVLQRVVNLGGGLIEIDWTPVANADGYLVWVSNDGRSWPRSQARWVTTDQHVADGLTGRVWIRVTARNGQGESDPGDAYGTRVQTGLSDILVVDGNDRYAFQFENPRGFGHDFVVRTAEVLGGRGFDSAANEAIGTSVFLDDYDTVIWVLGEESSTDETFDADEQAALAAWVATGGRHLLVSGAEIGWDLDWLGAATDQAFYTDVLKASYGADDAGTFAIEPAFSGVFAGIGELSFLAPGLLEANFPDELVPSGGADAALTYSTGGTAAVTWSGSYDIVHFGFPFETLDTLEDREAVMEACMQFFGI